MDWISVEDRLPKENGSYRIKVDGKEYPENNHFDDVDGFDVDCGFMYDWYTAGLTKVTHWMPLPKPPEDG